MSTPSDIPSQLTRLPAEAQAAFRKFRESGDEASLRIVVLASVRDFMPRNAAQSERTEPLRDDERLIEDLGFDSLAVAETVFFFEDLFKVTIRNEELLSMRTVGELCTYVARRIRELPPQS
jgi:acyl carrier protein